MRDISRVAFLRDNDSYAKCDKPDCPRRVPDGHGSARTVAAKARKHTREQLAAALGEVRISVGKVGHHESGPTAIASNLDMAAGALLAAIAHMPRSAAAVPAVPAAYEADEDDEVAIMQRMTRLERDDPAAVLRVIEWARNRRED